MVDKNDPLADNKLEDNTKIITLMYIDYSLKTLKLIIIISNCSYFIGIIWYIFCEFELDFQYGYDENHIEKNLIEGEVAFEDLDLF